MEGIFLLFTIASNLTSSIFLSFLLFLNRLLLLRRRPPSSSDASPADAALLYEGTVWHDRRRPVRHSFHYPVKYALFDLDATPCPPDGHLSPADARRFACTDGRVLLLTIPPSVGYEQNPLSLYYCYSLKGGTQHLDKCIAEVTNTPWGERVLFAFNPNSDVVAKPLHVSPFMDMLGNWIIKANAPGDNLSVCISVQHPELGNYFTATLNIKRVSSSSPQDHKMFFWLMPHKVAVWIYWHALLLWWKNVAFIQHPRYTNPSYREDACVRDHKLQCPELIARGESSHPASDPSNHSSKSNQNPEGPRNFVWRDAKWPWC
ncbi:hypothetical protein MLD38_019252 [Melastoma candidum]|uniref:Uncharacterized protein n=1 Tax=Melastoma candidum TaxID=119954 RepID=A0ACB9QVK1_9MYRT|nr:hypothetical protein MLD38_019252 [Melastoma candidum]